MLNGIAEIFGEPYKCLFVAMDEQVNGVRYMEASILTIDDSLPLHRLMKSIFDSQGVTFHSAYDGERGLAMAAHIHPDVILLDVDLPEMDGFEVCERLKNSQETSPIPVIFLTAGIASSDQAKGFGVGAADYITKPFVAEDLIASISSQLRNRKTEQRPVADRILSMQDRESLDEFVASQCNLASQRGQPMACISCDVDELRIINSRQGRATGDEVLRRVGQTLLGNSRNGETVVDCGGGKFVVVAPVSIAAAQAEWLTNFATKCRISELSGRKSRQRSHVHLASPTTRLPPPEFHFSIVPMGR